MSALRCRRIPESNGATCFGRIAGGNHRYLILTEEQEARALEAMVLLTTQPPAHQNKH